MIEKLLVLPGSQSQPQQSEDAQTCHILAFGHSPDRLGYCARKVYLFHCFAPDPPSDIATDVPLSPS